MSVGERANVSSTQGAAAAAAQLPTQTSSGMQGWWCTLVWLCCAEGLGQVCCSPTATTVLPDTHSLPVPAADRLVLLLPAADMLPRLRM